MNYYEQFSPEVMKTLKELNDKLITEGKETNPDNKKILKLKQQILLKGLELSNNLYGNNIGFF
jgi:TRAP-type mannitol/chloroaromatic compound transport system substrate-binding protein